jgi:NAD(P)-dependent dehydrogenase (short-subunit alcohol dehydrogenase family)
MFHPSMVTPEVRWMERVDGAGQSEVGGLDTPLRGYSTDGCSYAAGMGHTLVTGGSRGIGAAVRTLLLERGEKVSFTAATSAGDGAILTPDPAATDWGEVLDRAEAVSGPVTALVNNAGVTGGLAAFVDSDPAGVRRVFDVNVHATMELSQAVVRRWLQRGTHGVIVNVSSVAATTGAPGEYIGYAASKAAIDAFTMGLGRELGPHGIRVVGVSPGTTQTEIHERGGDPGRPARVAQRVPLRRVAEPREIAEAIVWALSPAASYVTGTTIAVSGGLGG